MKNFFYFLFLLLFHLAFTPIVLAQKSATIQFVDADKSLFEFIKEVELIGNKRYKQSNYNNDLTSIEDIDPGEYIIKYTTIFQDTLLEKVNLAKTKKYKISYPENIYSVVEYVQQLNSIHEIENHHFLLYLVTQEGCLGRWKDYLYLYKREGSLMASLSSGNDEVFLPFSWPHFAKLKTEDEFQHKFKAFVDKALTADFDSPAGYSGGIQSRGYLKYDNQVMRINFCPLKLEEWKELLALFPEDN